LNGVLCGKTGAAIFYRYHYGDYRSPNPFAATYFTKLLPA